MSHLADVLFFRFLAVIGLANEGWFQKQADSVMVIGCICLFLMPDWLRGRESLPMLALRAWMRRYERP